MTEMSMIERVARAIDPLLWRILDRPEDAEVFGHPDKRREYSLEKAEHALAAMREPTTHMVGTVREASNDRLFGDVAREWRAMIDAALSEKAP